MINMKPIFTLSPNSCRNSITKAVEQPYLDRLTKKINFNSVSYIVMLNARESSRVVASNALVSPVFKLSDKPKIVIGIIGSVVVEMINLLWREFTRHITERKAMRSIFNITYRDTYVPLEVFTSCNIPNLGAIGKANQPSKYSGLWIVIKKLFKSGLGYNFFSHNRTPIAVMLGGGMLKHPMTAIISEGKA